MEAKDLRMGNWVYNPIQKINILVDFNVLNLIRLDNLRYAREIKKGEECFQPIPLTEEILLKCGFDKIKIEHEEYSGFEYELSLGTYSKILVLDDFSYSIVCKKIEDNSVCFDKDILTSLHQLQNLYFALTNEELKYNG